MKKSARNLSLALMTAMLAMPAQSAFAERTKLGILDCKIADGTGYVVGSKKALDCYFTYDNGQIERYKGSIGKIGIDLGVTKNASLKWGVFQMKDKDLTEYPLEGSYVGVSAGATVGVGLGANALVGGSVMAIALQPLSVESRQGLNVDLGIANLQLNPAE